MNKVIKNAKNTFLLIFVLATSLFKADLGAIMAPVVVPAVAPVMASDAFGLPSTKKAQMIENVKNKHVLDLSGCNIEDLSDVQNQFAWLRDDLKRQVWVLNLSNNRLSTIAHDLLRCFPELKALSLSRNNFSSVEIAGEAEKLEVLDLSFNKIKEVRDLKIICANLKWLNLSHNEFHDVVSLLDFKNFRRLVCLILANNKIKYLSVQTRELCEDQAVRTQPIRNAFGPYLNDLRMVVLFGCTLKAVTAYDFHKLNLHSLDLGCNKISVCENGEGAFSELKKLQKLNLAGNKLTQISSKTFAGANGLKELNLDGNSIDSSKIDSEAFHDLIELEILSMRCQLKQKEQSDEASSDEICDAPTFVKLVTQMFYGLKHLKHLDLSLNGIKEIEISWSAGAESQLTHMNLAHNAITNVPARVRFSRDVYPKLEELNFKNNGLTSIDEFSKGSIFKRFKFAVLGDGSLLGFSINEEGNPIFDSLMYQWFVKPAKNVWKNKFGLSRVRKIILRVLGGFDGQSVRKLVFNKAQLMKDFDLSCVDLSLTPLISSSQIDKSASSLVVHKGLVSAEGSIFQDRITTEPIAAK